MGRKHALAAILLAGLGLPSVCLAGDGWENWFKKSILQRVQINGFRQLGYHTVKVEGDRDAFEVQNYSGQGGRRFTDFGQIQLSGRNVLGVLNFDAAIQDSRFNDPQGQRFSIDVDRGPWTLNYGDIQGLLPNTNRFATFNRSMKGTMVSYRNKGIQARAIHSAAKGRAQTVLINGNNTPGPYYLQATQIILDSETVELDGTRQQRGVDYLMNYEAGSIEFVGRSIPPSSTIAVNYEALGVNSLRGDLEGAGLSMDFGSEGRVGLTLMRQRDRAGFTSSTRLEKFFGFGPPGTPYILQFEPLLTEPFTVRVNGVLQTLGIDYVFDAVQPAVFYFTRFMPSTDEIDVTYTPKPTNTVDGDREVWAIDYRVPLGKRGSVSVGQALGKLLSPINPTSGTARNLDFTYDFGKRDSKDVLKPGYKLELRGALRDVQPGYTTIETRSLSRNEKATDYTLSYEPDPAERYQLRTGNALVATRRLDVNGNAVIQKTRVTSSDATYTVASTNGRSLDAGVSRRQTRSGSALSSVDTFSLNANQQLSRGSFRYGIQKQIGRAPRSGSSTVSNGFSLFGLTASADYLVFNKRKTDTLEIDGQTITRSSNESLRLDARMQWNQSESGGIGGTGRFFEVAARYDRPNWNVDLSVSDNDSGAVNSLGGFTGGSGVGLDGSGFNGGVIDGTGLGAARGTQARLYTVYRPNSNVSTFFEASLFSGRGGLSSNSTTRTLGIGGSADIKGHRLTFRADRNSTTFASSPIVAEATTLSGSLEGQLNRDWSYSLRGNILTTGGNTTFKQDGATLQAVSQYRISKREFLGLDLTLGNTTGFRPQRDASLSFVYGYDVYRGITLNGIYRIRDVRNLDVSSQSGAYRFQGFDLVLSFNFGR